MPSRNYERRDKKKKKKHKNKTASESFVRDATGYTVNKHDFGFGGYALTQCKPRDIHKTAQAVFGSTYYISSLDL